MLFTIYSTLPADGGAAAEAMDAPDGGSSKIDCIEDPITVDASGGGSSCDESWGECWMGLQPSACSLSDAEW